MARFFEIVESGNNLTQEELDAGKRPRRAFAPSGALARKLAREWNGGKSLRAGAPVSVEAHEVVGGKPGMVAFLNKLVGHEGVVGPGPRVKGERRAAKKAAKKRAKKKAE